MSPVTWKETSSPRAASAGRFATSVATKVAIGYFPDSSQRSRMAPIAAGTVTGERADVCREVPTLDGDRVAGEGQCHFPGEGIGLADGGDKWHRLAQKLFLHLVLGSGLFRHDAEGAYTFSRGLAGGFGRLVGRIYGWHFDVAAAGRGRRGCLCGG